LNFTAEFVGPVTPEQVSAFQAAFDGTTSLHRATIAQFAGIADAIGEDELIGFGLYHKDQAEEPAEWRCLSRRDALRIQEEVRLLASASAVDQDTRLPAIANSSSVARIFSERQERGVEPAKWVSYVRDVEANLDRRIGRVEKAIEGQSERIEDLHAKSSATEDNARKLLGAVEGFCAQTTRQLEAIAAPAVAAPPIPSAPEMVREERASEPALSSAEPVAVEPVMEAATAEPEAAPSLQWAQSSGVSQPPSRHWQAGVAAAFLVMGVIFLGTWVWQNFSSDPAPGRAATPVVKANDAAPRASAPESAPPGSGTPAPVTPTAAAALAAPPGGAIAGTPGGGGSLRIVASEPVWVSLRSADGPPILARLFVPGEERTLELPKRAILRAGNAGGIQVDWNGQSIGPLGGHGQVRDVIFRDGGFRISAIDQPQP
jgi:hypothetical protein